MNMNVNIKKLNNSATIPRYQTPFAAGADIYCCIDDDIIIAPGATVMISTGIALEIPDNYVGLVYPRSGLSTKFGIALANKVGVIDSDYRGELMVPLFNHSDKDYILKNSERIAQLVITPYLTASFCEVNELNQTKRGDSGFGSTGK